MFRGYLSRLMRHRRAAGQTVATLRPRHLRCEHLEDRELLAAYPVWPTFPFGTNIENRIYTNQFGDALVTGKDLTPGDIDQYVTAWKYPGLTTDTLTLSAETLGSTDTRLAAYFGNGAPGYTDDNMGVGSNAKITVQRSNISLRDYGYCVAGFDANTVGMYDLSINGPSPAVTPIAVDGTYHGMTTGTLIAQAAGYSTDFAFYSFTTTAAGNWSALVTPTSSWDPKITVFDSTGNPVGGSFIAPIDDWAGVHPEIWTGEMLAAGRTYYIRIDTAGTAATSFQVDIYGVNFDLNDQISESTEVKIGTPQNALISPGDDVDMYHFTAAMGQRIGFDIDSSSGLDSYLRVFDAAGVQLAANDDGYAPGETLRRDSYLEYTFTTGGDFYVGVSGYSNVAYNPLDGTGDVVGSTGSYTLTLSDVVDPDDQIREAVATGVGATASDTISPSGDVDMFRFTVVAGQRVAFNLNRTSGTLDSYVRIFDTAGNELAANDDGQQEGEPVSLDSYLEYTFGFTGTYYVGVSGHPNTAYDAITGDGDVPSTQGGYSLTLSSVVLDPDDQISEARSVLLGTSVEDLISAGGDVDMYSFVVASNQRVAFNLDRPSGDLDSYLRIFDVTGREIVANDDGAAPGEPASRESYLEYVFPAGGRYYIGVSGSPNNAYDPLTGLGDRWGSTGRYQLWFGEVTDTDDQLSEATILSMGQSVHAAITPSSDVDMYQFSGTFDQRVVIDVDSLSPGLDTYLRLFDASGTEVASNDDGAAPGERLATDSYLEYRVPATGVYFLGVSGFPNTAYNPVSGGGDAQGQVGDYNLRLDLPLPDDSREQNDSQAQVQAMLEGPQSPNLGLLTDAVTIPNLVMADGADWFRFRMDGTGTAADFVRIQFNSAQGDLDLAVFASDGVTLVGRSAGTGNEERVDLTGQPAGAYFVQVYGFNGAINPDYQLTIDPAVASLPATNYAVLFGGGADATSNDRRFYENLRGMYDVLLNEYALPESNIYVLYADGTAAGVDRADGQNSDMSFAGSSPVLAATGANLQATLATIAGKIRPTDHLLFYAYGQGGGDLNQPAVVGEETMAAWGGRIDDQELAAWLDGVGGERDTYVFAESFGGGMLDNVTMNSKRFGAAATNHYEVAQGDDFAAAFLGALRGGQGYTQDAFVRAVANDPSAIPGPYANNGGTVVSGREHPWMSGDNFPIFVPVASARPGQAPSPDQVTAAAPAAAPSDIKGTGAPVLDTFSLSPASSVMVGATVTLSATASDPDPLDSVVKVMFYEDANADGAAADNELIGSGQLSNGVWSMDWGTKNHALGTFTLLAVAEDGQQRKSGARTASLTLTPQTTNQPPVVTNFVVTPSSPFLPGDPVTLSATASDPDAGDQVSKVAFYVDRDQNGIGTADEFLAMGTNSGGTWSLLWDTKGQPAGQVQLLAIARDLHQQVSNPAILPVVFNAPAVNHPPQVAALGAEISDVRTVDDAQAVLTGPWSAVSGVGLSGMARRSMSLPGSSGSSIEWNFEVAPGQYNVAVSWPALTGLSGSVTYKLWDGDTLRGQVVVNQQVAPQDFTEGGASWKQLESVLVTGTSLRVTMANAAADGDVAADAVHIDLQPPRPANIASLAIGQVVTISAQVTDADAGDALNKVRFYEDRNGDGQPGVDELLTTDLSGADGWNLEWNSAGHAAGAVTILAVAYDSTNTPSATASVTLNLSASLQVVDNDGAGFGTGGAWSLVSGGLAGTARRSASVPGSRESSASWTFNVTPGQYSVDLTWPQLTGLSSNAPFYIWDGETLVAASGVNQQVPPDGGSDQGVAWQHLGNVQITGTRLVVTTWNATGDGDVAADAVRIQPVEVPPVINQAPAGTDVTRTILEDASYALTVADFGFTDPLDNPANNFVAVKITTLPLTGSLMLNGAPVAAGQVIAVTDIAANRLLYSPVPNASGTDYASFTFQVQDDGGTVNGGVDLDPTPNTFHFNVTAVNDAPAGGDVSKNVASSGTYTLTVADFGFSDPLDSPANNFLAVKITTLPAAGTLTLNGVAVAAGQAISVSDIAANRLLFVPPASASGVGDVSFTFQVQDDGGVANGGVDLDPTPNTFHFQVTVSAGDTPGVYNPDTSNFYLRDDQSSGDAQHVFMYGVANVSWVELVGDWDGDGMDTPGMYDSATATFYLTDQLSGADAQYVFNFGIASQGWKPLVGDWNGDGRDGIGLYEPATGIFFLKNSFVAGDADEAVQFGIGGKGWTPIVGDWDGLPGDGIGVYEPATSLFFLKNSHTSGPAEETFQFGVGNLGWVPLVGNWDGVAGDGVGFYVPHTSQWFLKNAHASGDADTSFTYGVGAVGWRPLVGHWQPTTTPAAAPMAAAAPLAATAVDQVNLSALAADQLGHSMDDDELFGGRPGSRRILL